MTLPLILLAVCAIALGFLGTPMHPWLQSKLLGHEIEPESLLSGGMLMMLSIVLVALGLGAGWAIYGRKLRQSATAKDSLETASPTVFAALAARLGFDELYAATVGRLNTAFAALADGFDRLVLDTAVRLVSRLAQFAGLVSLDNDDDALNAGFNATGEKLRATAQAYSKAQTGDAHGYLRTIALAFVVLVLLVVLGGGR